MKPHPQKLLERLPILTRQPLLSYTLVIALCVLAALVRHVLNPIFPPGFPYLTFFPAVILSAFLFGLGQGVVAAVLCGFMAWFLFIPPFYTFAIMPATGVALAFYIGVVSVDVALVHWMQVANRRLLSERERNALLADESRKHAERSELLFHELQHRVANNLQMVGAVIGLQKRSIADPAARQSLDEAANKLQLIGSIQRQLYDVTGGRVPVDGFLRKLMNDLVTSGGKPGVSYSVDAQENVLLDPNTLIPLALIMAESVANAIEHGFSGRERGHIAVRLEQAQSGFQLSVSDDGVGIPAGFDLDTASSLGLKIARTLAQQLGGELVIRKGNPHGTVSQLRFSETAAA